MTRQENQTAHKLQVHRTCRRRDVLQCIMGRTAENPKMCAEATFVSDFFPIMQIVHPSIRGETCHCRHCRQQCKVFTSGVNFSILLIFLFFLSPKLLKFCEIKGVKFLAWKSGGVKFLTNLMSAFYWDFYLANSLAGCFELGPIVKDCLKNVKTKFASKSNQDKIVWHHNENETK